MKMKHKNIGMALLLLLVTIVDAKEEKESHGAKKNRYDYIIVGGGAAGCILARKLSDNHKYSVLLLEAGADNGSNDSVTLDPFWLDNVNTLLYNPKYAMVYGIPGAGFATLGYSEGHEIGGGGAHNFLLDVRGTPRIYNSWQATTGDAKWNYAGNILPLMQSLEHYTPNGTIANPAERGFSGPIYSSQSVPLGAVPGDFMSSVSAVTLTPFVSDYNDPSLGDIGIAAAQQFITPNSAGVPPFTGARRSCSSLEFLYPVIDQNGKGLNGRKLTVISNANVLNIRINDGMRATSVHYSTYTAHGTDNDPIVLKASLTKNKGKLILAAGSIQTPTLLMRSGVGPANVLSDAGIPMVLESPQVGQNLQEQYGASTIIGGTIPFTAEFFLDGYPYMANDGIRRLQGINLDLGNGTFDSLLSILDSNVKGSITVVSNNPFLPPMVNFVPFADDVTVPGTDSYLQVAYFKIMKAAANLAGLPVFFPEPSHFPAPFGPAPDDSLLLADAKNAVVLQSHIVGTARMGTDISNGVVDGELKMFGLENVYIGDNSIQPLSVDGNTCWAAYIIALRLSQTLGVPTPPAL